jgi:hypothetical protein
VFLAEKIGVAGVVWGSVIAFLLIDLAPTAVLCRRVIDRVCRDTISPFEDGAGERGVAG